MRFFSALFASLAAQTAFAGVGSVPSKTGITSVDVGLSVIQGVQGSVDAEGQAVITFVEAGLLPLAKTTLGIISQQVQSINKTLTPYALDIIQPLAEAQLGNVLALLTRSQALVADIKDLASKLLTDVPEQSQKAIAAELKIVLATVRPMVEPIATLSKGLAGTATSETNKQIGTAVDNLEYAANAGLDPFRVAVDKLL